MNSLDLFKSIIGFEKSYDIINNKIMSDILKNENIQPNEIYFDHLTNIKNIANFSKIKYFQNNKILNNDINKSYECDPIDERNKHFKMKLEVLKKIPASLSDEIEHSRIILFAAWNKALHTKKFPLYEFGNYLAKYRKYSEIIAGVYKVKSPYDAVLQYNHPKISTKFLEGFFHKVANFIKPEFKKAYEISKGIKVTNLDSFLIKDIQYQDFLKIIKQDFDLDDKQTEFNQYKSRFNQSEFNFQNNFLIDLNIQIKNAIKNKIHDKNLLFENGCADLFVETVAYFFTSYLVRSNHYINNFGDAFRKIVRCKGKISDNTNLYWLFNRQGNDVNLNSCSEVSRLFFNMIFYIIERDLIDGKLSVDMMLNVWEEGIKNYFGSDVEIKHEYILRNENWALGKFGMPGFQSIAIVNGSMMFDQYSRKFSNKEYDRNIIKKFLANINSASIEYSAYATMEETMNNVEVFVKCYKERFI